MSQRLLINIREKYVTRGYRVGSSFSTTGPSNRGYYRSDAELWEATTELTTFSISYGSEYTESVLILSITLFKKTLLNDIFHRTRRTPPA